MAQEYLNELDFGDGVSRQFKSVNDITSIKVNGTSQAITNGAVDLDVANELITPTQWTALSTLYS